MEKNNQSFEENTYRTGDVYLPKNHRGLIAALMIAVIFLSGIVSVMGFWNIQLFRQLQKAEETTPRVQYNTDQQLPDQKDLSYNKVELPALGITGCLLTSFDQNYYGLPQGIYITDVISRSAAATRGLYPGDILVQLNGQAIRDITLLQNQLTENAGVEVLLTVYRNGSQYQITLPVE